MKKSKAAEACEKDLTERLAKYFGRPQWKVVDQKRKLPKVIPPKITRKKMNEMVHDFVQAGYMVIPCEITNLKKVEFVILKRFKGEKDFTYEPYKGGGHYNPCICPKGCIEVAANPIMELK